MKSEESKINKRQQPTKQTCVVDWYDWKFYSYGSLIWKFRILFNTCYYFQYIGSHIQGINLIQISWGQPDYLLSTCNATSAPVFGHHYCHSCVLRWYLETCKHIQLNTFIKHVFLKVAWIQNKELMPNQTFLLTGEKKKKKQYFYILPREKRNGFCYQ